MSLNYFGTDGIRGPVEGPLLQPSFVRRLGAAARAYLAEDGARPVPRVVLGRDTRASGEMLVEALEQGLWMQPVELLDTGVVPTPAVAWTMQQFQADLGIVVTASHNPATDNGIKFFAAGGVKLTEAQEARLEALLDATPEVPEGVIPVVRLHDAREAYRQWVGSLLPAEALAGWQVVVDTAHGATWRTTPPVLEAWGAFVVHLGGQPNGLNINDGLGSEHPELLRARVKGLRANIGLAHDGDGDRLIVVDETGEVVDGDQVLGLLALQALRQGRLKDNTLVVTVMSNLGLDAALQAAGGRTLRVGVGDRHVLHAMREGGYTLGGESSGHIICAQHLTTGDGLLAAVEILRVLLETGKPLSALKQEIPLFPQVTANLRVQEKIPFAQLPEMQAAFQQVEKDLGSGGRILVRYSGTEPKIRLLVEEKTRSGAENTLKRLKEIVSKHLVLSST